MSARLAIADPPYPPSRSEWVKRRASRWYGNGLAASDRPADRHADAAVWDDPTQHRRLLERLMDEFDGWAIATSSDGLAAYGDLPIGCRLMAWVKPNAQPGSHRILSTWEPVIVFPCVDRRSNRAGRGAIRDVLVADAPRVGFVGAKPAAWTHWILDALCYTIGDEVVDLFPGSGAVTEAVANYQPRLELAEVAGE